MQSCTRLRLLAISILGRSELLIFLFLFCLSLSAHSQGSRAFRITPCDRMYPFLPLWRLNSVKCQFEINWGGGFRRPASREGKWEQRWMKQGETIRREGGIRGERRITFENGFSGVFRWDPDKKILFVPQATCFHPVHFLVTADRMNPLFPSSHWVFLLARN